MLVDGYSDFSLEVPGCSPGEVIYRANFKLDADVTHLFPYINAVIEDATYSRAPHHIQFFLEGYRCALYPDKAVAALFDSREKAIGFLKQLMDFLNDLDMRRDSIEPDHSEYEPLPVLDLYRLLPHTNCGECGLSSCMAFASALSRAEIASIECPEMNDPASPNAAKLQSMM